MKKLKKLGFVSLSTLLSIGIMAPGVGAATFENEQKERVQIQIASTESVITKADLVEKLKALFPGRFDFLTENDFHMSSGHRFPSDDTIRYNLDFHKEMNGRHIHGAIGFVGEELEVQHFYYQPITTSEALFPPQVTKKEAEKIATAFLNQLSETDEYQIDTVNHYYPGNQTLVEPIRYGFSFVRTENNVPVDDQALQVSVLGNGEIVEFYRQSMSQGEQTYDDISEVLPQDEVLAKITENLAVDLRYQIEHDFQTGEPYVQLVYQPINGGLGVHAISGEWQTADGFTPNLPEQSQTEFLSDQPLEPRAADISLEEAKAFAEELLAVESDKVKLVIEAVDERVNYMGQEVISIHYMYEYANGAHGTSLEIDKQTGDIIQFHDIKQDVLQQFGEQKDSDKEISKNVALEKAIGYLKEYAPSTLHQYAQPVNENAFENEMNGFYFSFPLVVDGIMVNGAELFVSISKDGSLLSLNVNQPNIDHWPSKENVLSNEEALSAFKESLTVDLRYTNARNENEKNHYNLVYLPSYNGNLYSFMDANTGDWNTPYSNQEVQGEVDHPWAADELNYLINSGILKLDDAQAFDADAVLTKGEAIEVIMKSLTPFYRIYYPEQEVSGQSFDNIDRDHPLYSVIERAVDMGILTTEKTRFDVDAPLTREELAVWYIRALNLEQVAKQSGIYQLNFVDANEVEEKYAGHVVLVDSFGILTANNGRFNPDQEVTYSQLAVSIFRLAKEVYERNTQRYYY